MNAEFDEIAKFHGHKCPGLAMGYRMTTAVMKLLAESSAADEELVAIVENDACGVDALQWLTGCTFGKGNLMHLDYGKNAFTFYRRSDGKGVRMVARPEALASPDPEWEALRNRLGKEGLTSEEQHRFRELHKGRSQQILSTPLDQLFEFKKPHERIPHHARIMDGLTCESCGEQAMETRTRRFAGKTLCIPCFKQLEQR